MRLIDADALDNEMYRKSFEVDDGRNVWNSGLWIRYKIYEEASRDAPTVDATPVIRCKECKWWEYYDEGDFGITYGGCRSPQWFHTTSNGLETTGDDYCSWAERKQLHG